MYYVIMLVPIAYVLCYLIIMLVPIAYVLCYHNYVSAYKLSYVECQWSLIPKCGIHSNLKKYQKWGYILKVEPL